MSRACLLISFRHIVPAPEPIFQLELEQFFVLWRLGPEPAKKTTNTFSSPLFEEDVFTYPKTMKFGFWRNSTSKCTGTRRSRNAAVSACGIWTWSINNFQYVLLFKSVCAKSASSSSKPLDLMQVEEPFTLVIRRVYFVWAQLFKTSAHIPHSMTPKKDHSLWSQTCVPCGGTGLLLSKASRSRMRFIVLSPLVLKLLALKYSEIFAV